MSFLSQEPQPKQHGAEEKTMRYGLCTIIHTDVPTFWSQETSSSAYAMEDTCGPELCLVSVLWGQV